MRTVSGISRVNIQKGDIFGGATAAIVALPLALAFGVSSGAGALAGLYGAIFGGFFAAIFGGTKVQVTGPTGPMTVVMALIVLHFAPNLSSAFAVVVLAGAFQVLFGKLGIGRYIKLMPQPVVSGFMSGIGIIIIILQIGPLLGHKAPDGTILVKLAGVPQMFQAPNVSTLLLGAITLGITIFTPSRLARLVPPPLIAIAVGTIAGLTFFKAAPVIGAIPSGIPSFQFPAISYADLPHILRFALVLAFLGSIDSLLTSLVADNITRTSHDSNKELVGQGIGNMVCGLLGGLPGAGATMRTLVNVRAGGSSRLSGALHSVLLLAIVLGFSGAASTIPLAVLGGILVKVGIDIIDWRYLKRIHIAPRAGVVIMLATFLMTVFVDLITAVVAGFVMASVLFVARMADAQVNSAKFAFGTDQINDLSKEEEAILSGADGRIILFHLEGPLSFGSARDIAKLIQTDMEKDVLAIDLSYVPFIDTSAAAALEEAIQRLKNTGDAVLLFGARAAVISMLRKTGVLQQLDEKHLLDSRIDALRLAQEIRAQRKPIIRSCLRSER
jgi:SulP family sulfate permease